MSRFFNFGRKKFNKQQQDSVPRQSARVRFDSLEALESRLVPSANTISGFVYQDTNNNGLMDPGEQPIANSTLELRNSQGQVVATATSNAQGFYEFTSDNSVSSQPKTITKTLTFDENQTNFSADGLLEKFDTSLGELQSVEITHNGSISSVLKVENTSTKSTSSIQGTVGGSLNLSGGGVNLSLNVSDNVGNYNAAKYDGTLDFSGPSGFTFDAKTASGTKSITLTGAAMDAFKGPGNVTFTETATANSSANGGGNVLVSIESTAKATVTVTYTYKPSTALKPGNYTIIQTQQPNGYFDGKESSGGNVIPNSNTTDIIAVTLAANGTSTQNNFGELVQSAISGFAYQDNNNNGIKDPGEAGIQGVTVSLTGTDDQGNVSKTAVTDANGFYQFVNLRPGTYNLLETQPTNYLDGKDTAGTLGGTVTNDAISNIILPAGGQSSTNNFGEIRAAAISGFVYVDANNNGVKDGGESGIQGATVTLTGTDDNGAISQIAVTDASGFYQFVNLRPGSYALMETQPNGYLDGKDALGTQGGSLSDDQITNILLTAGTNGINNNFGELGASSISGYVYVDTNNNGIKDPGEMPLAGASVVLNGTNDKGQINQIALTDVNGFYQFTNLRPGTYQVSENQPAQYLDGKDTLGSAGGQAGNDQFSNIVLAQGVAGTNYNFGELAATGISGYVYVDANDNGTKDPGEVGIQNVTVTLAGFDDQGPVTKTITTDASGFYQFVGLRPGTYVLTETQPGSNYKDGKDTIGTQGGQVNNDQFTGIVLAAGAIGANYNFGELLNEQADVGIVKIATPPSVLIGGTVTYTLTITNYGESTAQEVKVIDVLPPGVGYVTGFGPGWTINQAGGTVTATLPSLAKGQSSTITITITAPQYVGNLVNTATVSTKTPDNNPDNNTSTVTVIVTSQPGEPFPRTIMPLAGPFGEVQIIRQGKFAASMQTIPINQLSNFGDYAVVDGLYRTLLGRPATAGETTNYANQLTAGTLTQAALVKILWNSDEHRIYQANQFYKVFYNRDATAAEKAATAAQLKAGVSETELAVQFMTSGEYFALNPSAQARAVSLFQDVLGMNPGTADLNATLQAMSNQTWESVVRSTLYSNASLALIVDEAFRTTVRRTATAAEINQWVAQLSAKTLTPEQLVQNLLSSQEFYLLAKNSSK